ncbi:MAG TPA: hypothetical protein VHO06_15535 [Polyangia bacterium]|nr:hypothetical protein [Polyangia bacterium]
MQEPDGQIDKQSEIRHLLRHVKTSLELAIVARAPADLLNGLGRAAGLLDAVSQLPTDEGPAQALIPGLIRDGQAAVLAWEKWHRSRLPIA